MCGILGQLRAEPSRFGRALQELRFRGRDQEGWAELGSFRLGCCRLAITDEAGRQPLILGDPGDRLALVMNGSLAHPGRWRRRLALMGEACRTGNDAEIPLRLYRAKGPPGLRELAGQFALALLDEAGKKLVLGRDLFGEKPLFLDERGGGLPSFASSPKALALLGGEAFPELPRAEAARFARFGWLDLEGGGLGTPFRSLPRGRIRVYEPCGRFRDLPLRDPGGGEEELPVLLEEALEGRWHGDRRIGLFLSGGLDSTTLAWLCAKLGKDPLCLSLDFEGLPPEGERAFRVSVELGLRHRRFLAGPSILADLQGLVEKAGLPLGDPSVLAVHFLSRRASEEGLGVVLTGEGGDELFLGYRRQRAAAWLELMRKLLPPALLSALGGARRILPRGGYGDRFLRVCSPGEGPAYPGLWSVADPREVALLFEGEEGRLPPSPAGTGPEAREAELGGYLAWDLCPKLDLASLAAGLEARSPFLDPRLLAHVRRKVRSTGETQGKMPLRRLLAVLPSELRSGGKRGFALPLAAWMQGSPWAREILGDPSLRSLGPWRSDRALHWLGELEQGRRPDRAHLLFNLCSLALHLRDRRRAA